MLGHTHAYHRWEINRPISNWTDSTLENDKRGDSNPDSVICIVVQTKISEGQEGDFNLWRRQAPSQGAAKASKVTIHILELSKWAHLQKDYLNPQKD